MSDYDIVLMREKLKSAADRDATKVAMLEEAYAVGPRDGLVDNLTGSLMAYAIARNEHDRAALSSAFNAVDRDGDIWLAWADIWLKHIGVIEPYWDADLSVLEDMSPTRKRPK